ncbi:hypothetical protein E2C01_004364 [Portunus trituberculatus]|uniref:Uncharacterized protein n=1 Tax=Portunus trituberculatus TaxID=210409 RepID=A0A5B7CW72_PORTR|nr:hypothetical protein [Portunus trituberculatus]
MDSAWNTAPEQRGQRDWPSLARILLTSSTVKAAFFTVVCMSSSHLTTGRSCEGRVSWPLLTHRRIETHAMFSAVSTPPAPEAKP